MTMRTALTIAHNIFLTREQRYGLYDGEEINAIGTSVPVWFRKGTTSEPANEIFTNYKLINNDKGIFIKHTEDGCYEISLPKNSSNEMRKPPEDIWETLSSEQQEAWYSNNQANPSLANLLDLKDGGCLWLAFRQFNKIKQGKSSINVVHFVEIKDINELITTLT